MAKCGVVLSLGSDGDCTRQSTASSPNLEPVALPDVQQLRLGSFRLSWRRPRGSNVCSTCSMLRIRLAAALDPEQEVLHALGFQNSSDDFQTSAARQELGLCP